MDETAMNETPLNDSLPPTSRRLVRSVDDRIVAGVCGGLARYLNRDPTLVRVIFGFLLLPGGAPGLVPYLILWAVTPDQDGRRQSLPVVGLLLFLGLPALCVFCWLGMILLGMSGVVVGGMMGH